MIRLNNTFKKINKLQARNYFVAQGVGIPLPKGKYNIKNYPNIKYMNNQYIELQTLNPKGIIVWSSCNQTCLKQLTPSVESCDSIIIFAERVNTSANNQFIGNQIQVDPYAIYPDFETKQQIIVNFLKHFDINPDDDIKKLFCYDNAYDPLNKFLETNKFKKMKDLINPYLVAMN